MLKDFRRLATRYELARNFFPASPSSPPWSTGCELMSLDPNCREDGAEDQSAIGPADLCPS